MLSILRTAPRFLTLSLHVSRAGNHPLSCSLSAAICSAAVVAEIQQACLNVPSVGGVPASRPPPLRAEALESEPVDAAPAAAAPESRTESERVSERESEHESGHQPEPENEPEPESTPGPATLSMPTVSSAEVTAISEHELAAAIDLEPESAAAIEPESESAAAIELESESAAEGQPEGWPLVRVLTIKDMRGYLTIVRRAATALWMGIDARGARVEATLSSGPLTPGEAEGFVGTGGRVQCCYVG